MKSLLVAVDCRFPMLIRRPGGGPIGSATRGPGAVGGVIIALLLLLLAGSPPAAAADDASARQAIHILDRVAFGPSAQDLAHIREVGIDRYIAEQLNPGSIPESPALAQRLAKLETLHLTSPELLARYHETANTGGGKPSREERREMRKNARFVLAEASEARLLRAIYSRRQLNEVMVDFWFNHFNIYSGKAFRGLLAGAFEEQAIRPYVLGKFRDLLLATARHPAMLKYLDNQKNSASETKLRNGKETGLNENYAREVMELHTLGVDGGYTQDDVVALARILTGWSFVRNDRASEAGTGFRFKKKRHDFGPKRFLGRDIAPSGEAEGIEALTMLARHPATARHISFKLAQYFVDDKPPQELVDRLAKRFQETDGDIRAVLQVLFASHEFRDSIGTKYKTPYRYVVSAVRAAGVPVDDTRPLLRQLADLGMPLYGCQTPDGYADTADKWLNPAAGPKRVNFALALAAGGTPPVRQAVSQAADMYDQSEISSPAAADGKVSEQPVDAAAVQALLDPIFSERTRAAVAGAPAGERAALLLGSPDFMRR
jgi:uncharacterized protein (DUF1800 family)